MKKNLNVNLVLGLIILFLCGFLYYATFSFAQPDEPWAAESFPRLIIFMMTFTGVIIFARGFFEPKGIQIEDKDGLFRTILLFVVAAVYLALLPVLGYIPATIGMLFIALFLYKNTKKTTVAAVAILAPIVIYLVFTRLLSVRLP